MIGDFHYCLLVAFFSGLLCTIFITKFFYGSQVPWGTVADQGAPHFAQPLLLRM